MQITSKNALAQLQNIPQPFLEVFQHGSLNAEIYRPEKVDLQQPHDRDEIYVVVSGTGKFDNNGIVTDFGPHDFLFVPAHTPHRFFDFSDDFATWVFFYGPKGGEKPLSVAIKDWDAKYQPDFFRLNKAWIEVDYALEPLDIAVLSDPETHIIRPGGAILSALVGETVIGVVALRPFADHCFELTKMVVDNRWRGLKIGEKLMYAALEEAKRRGAPKVVLFSNTQTAGPAVKLYHKVGWKEVELESGVYKRADIKMEYSF